MGGQGHSRGQCHTFKALLQPNGVKLPNCYQGVYGKAIPRISTPAAAYWYAENVDFVCSLRTCGEAAPAEPPSARQTYYLARYATPNKPLLRHRLETATELVPCV